MSTAFQLGAKVSFTQERLSVLTPRDRQGLAGRIGIIQTDCNRVRKPTVYFPEDGNKLELRLFNVDPRQLELVENPPEPEIAPRLSEDVHHAAATPVTADVATVAPAADAGDKLSQDDMDDYFN